jgi:hypothetical protein
MFIDAYYRIYKYDPRISQNAGEGLEDEIGRSESK